MGRTAVAGSLWECSQAGGGATRFSCTTRGLVLPMVAKTAKIQRTRIVIHFERVHLDLPAATESLLLQPYATDALITTAVPYG